MDFSCATCHADTGKRIRLQGLPFLSKPEEARKVIGEWPAYRVSQGTVMTMQHRIADCYWQMRLPLIDYGSDVTVALTMYLVNQAKGGEITAPQHQALGERHADALLIVAVAAGLVAGRRAYLLWRPQVDAADRRRRHQGELDDGGARLAGAPAQDETQKVCSQYRNAPPKAVADAIVGAREGQPSISADGKLMGDWKKGEQLAQSGYGGRFTDYPPRQPRTAATAMPAISSTRRS